MPLDIAAGIFLSLIVGHLFAIHVNEGVFLFGIASTLFPDIDMLPILRRISYDHRSRFHWPLLYVPVATAAYLLFGSLYATLFSLGILVHFIHDTVGIGWGVAWLAPFSFRKLLFPERGRRKEYGWYMSWSPYEEAAMAAKYHDPQWIKTYYSRPNPIAYVEYTALVVSIFTLIVYYSLS